MTNASNIINAHNYYNACNSDELHNALMIALAIRKDPTSSSADLYEANLTIGLIQDIVVRRKGFDL